MIVCRTKSEVRKAVAAARKDGKSIGVVPTMGALHEGHMSLVRRSVRENGATVVTIFVNPTQFGPKEDLSKYPRQLEEDVRMCSQAGADIVFAPDVGEMYPADFTTYVEETRLSKGLCGVSRPTHFRGVTTVVAKLFNIVQADRAYFGQKDAQQATVIRRMTRDLDFPIGIVVCPTVREAEGLAMSSRNKYLSNGQKGQALVLSKALAAAGKAFNGGERKAAALKELMYGIVGGAPEAKVDYIEVVDAETLEPVAEVERPALVAMAVFFGGTRLIDNTVLGG